MPCKCLRLVWRGEGRGSRKIKTQGDVKSGNNNNIANTAAAVPAILCPVDIPLFISIGMGQGSLSKNREVPQMDQRMTYQSKNQSGTQTHHFYNFPPL
eukprot:2781326-Ditylum_brightwellii.AAC.1